MNRAKKNFLLLIVCILSSPVSAQVSLPKLISDGMVLQRDLDLKLWGWASPGEEVALTFKGRTLTQQPVGMETGRYKFLPRMPAGPIKWYLKQVTGYW
jgi:sialate O-acetylesterase